MKFHQFPAGTRRPGDVPWRSPKGSDVRDLQGTFKGLIGDQQKIWWFHKKGCFLDAIVFVLHIYYFFLLEKHIQKFYMGMSTGRLRDPFAGRPRDQIMGLSGDVRGTFVIYVF